MSNRALILSNLSRKLSDGRYGNRMCGVGLLKACHEQIASDAERIMELELGLEAVRAVGWPVQRETLRAAE